MHDIDILYRNDNIQNVEYLFQSCGENCDSKSKAVQCDVCDMWMHYKCERLGTALSALMTLKTTLTVCTYVVVVKL